MRASEERKLVTVLFADLVGSTELGEQDPERTRALLDRFYDAMAAEIQQAGGTVEKFVGDAVMAAFGAPIAHEDDAERALHAALSMQRRLEELFGETLALRIGVNTGEVVVGRPREGSSFVTGDAVNVAARLEQAAAPGEILVGERTVTAARGAFEFAEPALVESRGKAGGVAARRLVRPLSLMRPRGLSGLHRAFVGRKTELGALEDAYREVAAEGAPRLVTISGDAGLGKTRLAREFWEWLGAEAPGSLRRTGRCLPYGHGITYWPLAEILKEELGLLDSDSPEVALGRLAGREILGLTLGLDVGGDLHPLAARDRLQMAWVDFLEERAAGRPVVLLVEDLHWGESPLLDLLERLLDDVRGPLLVVATTRPELFDLRPGWGARRPHASLLALEPLSPQQSARMLQELLASELPTPLRDVVVERAEGNPFFVEELLATLVDGGILERSNGTWHVRELPAGFAIPDSVQAVLAARIDLLAPADKAALQAAAVIGRTFWAGPVYELVEGMEPDLRTLEERDFVRRRPGSSLAGEQEYAIKHALTREVAYGSLPKARRARLHAAFARWLERLGAGRDEHASLLAHHYSEAVRPEDADLVWSGADDERGQLEQRAVKWLRRAADLAVGRYEIDEALALLRRGLELEQADEAKADLLRTIGRANALKFDGEAFWTAMQEAIALSSGSAALAELYADLAYETANRGGMWKRMPDHELLAGWIERTLELAEPGTASRAKGLIAKTWQDPSAAREAAIEASSIAERLADVHLRCDAWDARSHVAFAAGNYHEAAEWAERALDLIDEVSDPDLRASIFGGPVWGHLACGRMDDARRLARLHGETAEALTAHHRVHAVALVLEVEEVAGGWELIRSLEDPVARAVAANIATPCVRNARALLLCALGRTYLGDAQAGRRLEAESEALGTEGYYQVLDPPRIRLALARQDLEAVERLVARSNAPAVEGWWSLAAIPAWLDGVAALGERGRIESAAPGLLRPKTYFEPFALRALGLVREDANLVEQAAARFEAMNLDWHAQQTRSLL